MSYGKLKLREYYSEHIENDIFKGIDINTREELLQLAEEENIKEPINWTAWDRVVEETKQLLKTVHGRKKMAKVLRPKYVYDLKTKKLIGFYKGAAEASKALGISESVILNYTSLKKPYLKENLYFSSEPMEKDQIPTVEHCGFKCLLVYRDSTNKLLGKFTSLREAERYFHLPTATISYVINYHKGTYPKKDLRFEKIPI